MSEVRIADGNWSGIETPEGRPAGDAFPVPDSQSIAAALDRVIGSASLAASDRSRNILAYLVRESLEGRGDRIKAYSIATEVLGRPSSFDPQKDPIVRIEAARLRRDLEHYYLTEGQHDHVVISIPKGAYVPQFSIREAQAQAGVAPAVRRNRNAPAMLLALALAVLLLAGGLGWYLWSDLPAGETADPHVHTPGLVIKPLVDLTQTRESNLLARGLTERIIEKTSRFKELQVIAVDSATDNIPAADARYVLGGTLRLEEDLVVQVRLADRMDGRVIWAESFDAELSPKELFDVEARVSDEVSARVASPAGLIFEAERNAQLPPKNWSSDLCTLSYYAYRDEYNPAEFASVRDCLERAVSENPNNATAWALLALTYIDEARFLFAAPAGDQTPALEQAYDAARRATDLDATNLRAQQALMMAMFFRGDHKTSIEIGEAALAINPNDAEFKGEFGFRLALSGEWDRGCRLVQEALDVSAQKAAYYKAALALCAFMKGDAQRAEVLIGQAMQLENPGFVTISAAILAENGGAERALKNRLWLERNLAQMLPLHLKSITERLVRPEDRTRFRNALRKAGLDVPSG